MVIFATGNSRPEFLTAALALSTDSLTAVAGRPTIINFGIPLEISVSTSIM